MAWALRRARRAVSAPGSLLQAECCCHYCMLTRVAVPATAHPLEPQCAWPLNAHTSECWSMKWFPEAPHPQSFKSGNICGREAEFRLLLSHKQHSALSAVCIKDSSNPYHNPTRRLCYYHYAADKKTEAQGGVLTCQAVGSPAVFTAGPPELGPHPYPAGPCLSVTRESIS